MCLRNRLGVWLIFFALAFVAETRGSTTALSYRVTFEPADLERDSTPGKPAVPRFTWRVLLPYGTELAGAQLLPGVARTRRLVSYPLTPYPRPLCGGVALDTPAPYRFAEGEAYPANHWGGVRTLVKHGYRIAEVTIFPVLAFPAHGEASAIDDAEFRLELRAAPPEPLYRGLPDDRAEALLLADDSEAIRTYPAATARASVDYLVIAPQAFLDDNGEHSLSALLAEKEYRLLSTATLGVEALTRDVPGRDVPEKIRNAIVARYRTGLRFVLLVGNGHSITPTRNLSVALKDGTLPSDLYFACLDGSFDGNGNGVFGEVKDGVGGGDVDLACEVAVGRAPVSSLADVHAFVDKTLRMAAVMPSDPRVRNTLLFGEVLDPNTLGARTLRQLIDGGKAGGISTVGFPTSIAATQLSETHAKQFSGGETIQTLNGGEFYTVNHLGHAMQNYCMRFNSTAIPQLRNEFPFFGITQGCHPGDLRVPNWASKLVVSAEGGAAAMIANSNFGYFNPGTTDGASNRFHLVFWDSVFNEYHRYIGRAHFRAKERLIAQAKSDPYLRWVLYETNLLGDPELVLKF